MTVQASRRKPSRLEVLLRTRDLAVYTCHIASNPKNFDPKYWDALGDDLVRTAKDIHADAWMANEVRVGTDDGWQERRARRLCLQARAIEGCGRMIALIDLAQGLYHLDTRRVRHWARLVVDARRLLRAWRESDARRTSCP